MNKVFPVFNRELMELRSGRMLAAVGLFTFLQFFLALNSKTHGRIEDVLLVFQAGGIVAVIMVFDLIARERETHTIDLLLTQGISKAGLFIAKWLAMVVFCGVGAAGFVLGNTAGTWISGAEVIWLNILAQGAMVWWLFSVYGAFSLLFSVLFRRAKWALIGAACIWVGFRPPVLALLVLNPLKEAFQWTKSQLWQVLAFMPEFAFHIGLDPVRGAPEGVTLNTSWSYVALAAYVVVLSLAAFLIFVRQDEPVV